MTPVPMPKANENMTEATLERWLVREGQAIALNDALCTIITDKASFELPAPAAGVVRRLLGVERSVLPVGYILCAIGDAQEQVPHEYEERNRQTLVAHRGATVASAAPSGAITPVQGAEITAIRATPAARRVAREAGIALADVAQALKTAEPISENDVRSYLKNLGR